MTETFDAEGALEAVNGWNAAWMAQDIDRMKTIAADDFIQWHSNIRKNFTKDEEFAMLEQAVTMMRMTFHDIALTLLDNGVLQRCLGDIQLKDGRITPDIPLAMIYRTRGAQIVRCDEYIDGESLPRLDFIPAN